MSMEQMPASLARWLASCPAESFGSGDTLIAPDATPTHGWYLRAGLVRVYSLGIDGAIYNHDFPTAGDWVFGRLMRRGNEICCADRAIGAEAVQPTEAVRVSVADLDRWRTSNPAVAAYLFDTLMRMTASCLTREADLVQLSAEQRYLDLVSRRPALLDVVPLRQIAAWLGITPVALSRIRRRLSPKGQERD